MSHEQTPSTSRQAAAVLSSLAARIRKDGWRRTVGHCFAVAKLWAYQAFHDSRFDSLEAYNSGRPHIVATSEFVGPVPPPSERFYRAFPRLPFLWSIDALGIEPACYSFVDYGAGRGRLLLAAARVPFRCIVGVECARSLHSDAAANIAAYPRDGLKCQDISVLNEDALEFDLPPGNVVAFFYNPFTGDMLDKVGARIAASCRGSGRSVLIIFANSNRVPLFAGCPEIRPFKPRLQHRIWLALLSPVPIEFYSVGQVAS